MRIKIMRELIRSCNPQRGVICELGAGRKCISHGIGCRKRTTIDIDPGTGPDIVHDLTQSIPLPDDSTDIVVAGEILEHVYNSRGFIQEIRRVLKPNGYLIISVPNICSLRYRMSFLAGRIPAHAAKADCTYASGEHGHIRDYSFGEVRKLLKGFRIVSERSDTRLPKTLGNAVIIMAQIMK